MHLMRLVCALLLGNAALANSVVRNELESSPGIMKVFINGNFLPVDLNKFLRYYTKLYGEPNNVMSDVRNKNWMVNYLGKMYSMKNYDMLRPHRSSIFHRPKKRPGLNLFQKSTFGSGFHMTDTTPQYMKIAQMPFPYGPAADALNKDLLVSGEKMKRAHVKSGAVANGLQSTEATEEPQTVTTQTDELEDEECEEPPTTTEEVSSSKADVPKKPSALDDLENDYDYLMDSSNQKSERVTFRSDKYFNKFTAPAMSFHKFRPTREKGRCTSLPVWTLPANYIVNSKKNSVKVLEHCTLTMNVHSPSATQKPEGISTSERKLSIIRVISSQSTSVSPSTQCTTQKTPLTSPSEVEKFTTPPAEIELQGLAKNHKIVLKIPHLLSEVPVIIMRDDRSGNVSLSFVRDNIFDSKNRLYDKRKITSLHKSGFPRSSSKYDVYLRKHTLPKSKVNRRLLNSPAAFSPYRLRVTRPFPIPIEALPIEPLERLYGLSAQQRLNPPFYPHPYIPGSRNDLYPMYSYLNRNQFPPSSAPASQNDYN